MRLNSSFQFPPGWEWLMYVLLLWSLTGFGLAGSVILTLLFHKDFQWWKLDAYRAQQQGGYFLLRPEYARLRRRFFTGIGMFISTIVLLWLLTIFFGH